MAPASLTDRTNFDAAIVGSSPLSLAYAAMQARNGRRVCVIEQSANLGGAWAVDDALALKSIETSPHVFLPHKDGYDLLDDLLNAGFKPLPIEPQLHWLSGSQLSRRAAVPVSDPVGYRRTLARAALVHANWTKPKSVARRLRRLVAAMSPGQSAGGSRHTAMYPPDGLVGLFERAEESLSRLHVEILKRRKAVSLSVRSGTAIAELDDGSSVEAQKVYLTRHSDLAKVNGVEPALEIETYVKSAVHFVFAVKGASPGGFIQFCGQSPLMFVNDVTDYSLDFAFKKSGMRLICARAVTGKDMSLAEVMTALKQIGYLPQAAELAGGKSELRHVRKISEESIRLVRKRCAPAVDFLLSDDLGLMDSIAALRTGETPA